MPEQSVFFGGKQSSGLTNTLLLLNLVGIVVIIILLLWWWPWYWGHGRAAVIGGAATPGPGGNIIIDTCCDGGSRDCPGDKPSYSCEDDCMKRYPNDPRASKECIALKCGKDEPSCKDKCHDRYPTNSLMESECIRVECDGGNGCPKNCWQRYSDNTQMYQTCIRTECTPPPTETCEDYCKTVYGSPGMENYYQQCLRERCEEQPTGTVVHPKQPDCRDSDGYNLGTAGKVVADDVTYSDTCYSSTEVTEYTCDGDTMKMRREPCPGRCEYGRCVPGTTTTQPDACTQYCQQAYGTSSSSMMQQCIQQHWCPV